MAIINLSVPEFLFFFFASPKKKQKKTPEIDYIPISGWFPDYAFVLLWLQHL